MGIGPTTQSDSAGRICHREVEDWPHIEMYTTEWYVFVSMDEPMLNRVFKTKGFAARASKASISDDDLCQAMGEVLRGQADDLGGGIWKKRLNHNRHRSIILAKGRSCWVYQFLFAKQDLSNISKSELLAFRALARAYERLTAAQLQHLLERQDFVEICNGEKI
jgi:hypothetical protein